MTQAGDVSQTKIELSADVVVVGSGAGGAVAAYELARAGKSVIVLEAGPYVPSSEFTEDFARALVQLYQDGGAQANKDGDLLVLQGRCVGGSTVVNGCVAFRTPDYILADWQQRFVEEDGAKSAKSGDNVGLILDPSNIHVFGAGGLTV